MHKIAFEEYVQSNSGFVYHEDIVQSQLSDERVNQIVLGLRPEAACFENEDPDLEWTRSEHATKYCGSVLSA